MPHQFVSFIVQYGYLAVILLVFLQQMGLPTPIPTELILVFSGCLSSNGLLNMPIVVLSVIVGDVVSSIALFVIFYYFGKLFFRAKPRWIPLKPETVDRFAKRINLNNNFSISLARITPVIRGYTSVVSGFSRFSPKRYSLILLITSFIWSFGYVFCGYLIGSSFDYISFYNSYQWLVISIPIIVVIIFILIEYIKKSVSIKNRIC